MDEKEKITVDETVPENNSEPQDKAENTNTAEDEKAKEAHRDGKARRKIFVITGILLALIFLAIVLVFCLRGCRDGSGEGTKGDSGITASSRRTATSAESTAASTNKAVTTAKSTTASVAPEQTQNSTGTQAPTKAPAQETTATPPPANPTKAPTKAPTATQPTNPPANRVYHTAWGTRPHEFECISTSPMKVDDLGPTGYYAHIDPYGNSWVDTNPNNDKVGSHKIFYQPYGNTAYCGNGRWTNGQYYWGEYDYQQLTIMSDGMLPFHVDNFDYDIDHGTCLNAMLVAECNEFLRYFMMYDDYWQGFHGTSITQEIIDFYNMSVQIGDTGNYNFGITQQKLSSLNLTKIVTIQEFLATL